MNAPTLFDVPMIFPDDTARARRHDLVTSHEAADSNDVTRSLGLVLDILASSADALTDGEIETRAVVGHHSQFTGQRLRTARNHLVRLGLVHRSELFGFTKYGRRAAMWQVTR